MDTELPLYLYHGTSLHSFRVIKFTYDITNLYAGDDLDLAISLAKSKAEEEQSSPVIIILEREKLKHLISYNQPGCFTGNIRNAIVRAYICDEGEVGLKL